MYYYVCVYTYIYIYIYIYIGLTTGLWSEASTSCKFRKKRKTESYTHSRALCCEFVGQGTHPEQAGGI